MLSIWIPSLLALAVLPATPVTPAAETPYTMGVFPFVSVWRLEPAFAPLAADLAQALGRRVLLRTGASFEDFRRQLREQRYDVAFVQPFDYVEVARDAGYLPVASRNAKLYASFLVRSDSDLTGLAELRGRRVATPPASAAVSRLGRMALTAAGVDPGDVVLVEKRSHDACLQALAARSVDACVTAEPPAARFRRDTAVELIELARSIEIPHTLWIVHGRVPEAQRQRIRDRLLAQTRYPLEDRARPAGDPQPFRAVDDTDYAALLGER